MVWSKFCYSTCQKQFPKQRWTLQINTVSAETSEPRHPAPSDWRSVVRAAGLVFGDIGTSPIYTMTVIFLLLPPTRDNILGVVSLILWTLVVIVFGQYVLLAMKLDHFGEGGTLILKRIAEEYVRPGKLATTIGALSFLGATLLLGDGVITPAISILSAVEGIRLIPPFQHASTALIVAIAVVIAVWLFFSQPKGSDHVAAAFGPVMALWFLALGVTGLLAIAETPTILQAVNPYYAMRFCWEHGLATFLILSQIILCATGAEALYADMGHVGKEPIIRAWMFVFVALALSYLGQGAFVMHKHQVSVLLFGMVHHQSQVWYIPFLVLSIMATVIASQSLISGAFSVIFQAISMGKFPLLKVNFTSSRLKSQIYIGVVNWALMCSVIFMMIYFKKSENLTAAYGLAVTGAMTIDALLMAIVYYHKKAWWRFALCPAFFIVAASFFGSCLTKLPTGGYWSLIITSVPLSILSIWSIGEAALSRKKGAVSLPEFIPRYIEQYSGKRLPGTAVYSTPNNKMAPPYVMACMFQHGIVYDQNVFISVVIKDEPHGFAVTPMRKLAEGLYQCEIHIGYMELNRDLKQGIYDAGIAPRVVFYGMDRIAPKRPLWLPYAMLKRLTPIYTSHFNVTLPGAKTHGVVYRVDMG
jgi:KUP system potassium uptake protein